METVKPTLSPGAYKDYINSIKNHLVPFFENNPIQLHEIQYDTLVMLLNSIKRGGKGKLNVMSCFHACLNYAWKSRCIPTVPPFPDKKLYNIVEPVIEWIPEERQQTVIQAIPLEHQPIFWWLKFHLRRPAEATALYKDDFIDGEFVIKRGFSATQLIDRRKTGEIHLVPMVNDFAQYLEIEKDKQQKHGIISPYFFVHPEGRKEEKH